jgi:hypothetical protein
VEKAESDAKKVIADAAAVAATAEIKKQEARRAGCFKSMHVVFF